RLIVSNLAVCTVGDVAHLEFAMSLTHSGSCCRLAATLLRGIRSSGRHALFTPSFGLCWPLHHCYIVVTGNFRGIDAEFCSDNRSHLTLRSDRRSRQAHRER